MCSLPKRNIQNPVLLSSSILMLLLCYNATCTPNTTIKIVQCNSGSYTQGDSFAISLSYVILELENVTPFHKGYDFHNISPYPNAFAYGHAACNQTLTGSDCATCLGSAKIALLDTCEDRIGARSVLYDCVIRYEQYPFND
ncbi:hypothetical protein RD792_009415 [Penstemon davidsonii]|uniref:Gnk2-homologous domain-containing protein n=1 Tax=Penstemon davidsonii TaxID=160366 RepID=A0ABR0CZR7_9LAMI|nr:hypothetical protein RD792_009415 [Penstemon davidsonii]